MRPDPAPTQTTVILINALGEITTVTRTGEALFDGRLRPGTQIRDVVAEFPWKELLEGERTETECIGRLVAEAGRDADLCVHAKRTVEPLGAVVILESCALVDAEKRLHASERRHRSIFETSLDGVLLTTPVGEILAANPAACRLLGRTEQELRGIGRAGIIDPADARLTKLLDQRARAGRSSGQVRLVRKDGTRFEAEISSSLFTEADGSVGASWAVRDVSARERAAEALRFVAEAGKLLAASLDYETTLQSLVRLVVPRIADVCFVDLLEDGALRRVAVADRVRSREAQIRTQRVGTVGFTTTRGVERVVQTGEPELVPVVDDAWIRSATRNEAHYRSVREVQLRSALIVPLCQREQVAGALSLGRRVGRPDFQADDVPLARGIADRAALAIDSARLYSTAVEAKRLRDELVGIVSHDLRGPLTAIHLNAQILASHQSDPRVSSILRAADRANQLVDDLLTAATIESQGLPLDRRSEDVRAVLAEVVELHRSLADEKGVAITLETPPALPFVDCDRHRLFQLLSNLVNNAIKFTQAGGRIGVRGEAVDGALRVSITDTGTGIAPDDMPRLFDRYWQASRARRAGAGLGLTIVKGIADAHGWKLGVRSRLGSGSTFTVEMPVASSAAAAPEPQPSA